MPVDKTCDETIFELKKQRGSLKGRITQFKKFVDSFRGASLTPLQVEECKVRIQAASELFSKFNVIESELESLLSDTELESNSEYVETLESVYFTAMASANCFIHNAKTSGRAPDDSSFRKPISIKLPEIKLPIFDGSYDNWLEFKHCYTTMIHKRTDLDEIQKLQYLRSALTGSALQVISALEFSPANYIHAWELLENRFHNDRLLVNNHVKALFNSATLKSESSMQIRKLIDTVLRNLRALNTLDEPTEKWDTLVIYLIVTKLDASTEREWESHKGAMSLGVKDKVKLEDLLSFLRNRADMLDMVSANHSKPKESHTSDKSDNKYHNDHKRSSHRIHSYASTKTKFNRNNFKKDLPNCVLCNQGHALFTCISFLNMSVSDRSKFINEKKLCRNCLRSGHIIDDCLFGPCRQCQGKHNSLLHFDSNVNYACVGNESRGEASHAHTHNATALHSLPNSNENNIVVCDEATNSFKSIHTVLLSTALVKVADDNNVFHIVRALLDSGSQNCFITEKLSKRINATYLKSTVHVSGVGQYVTQSCHSCDISIRSKVNDYSTKIRCIILPCITSSLPTINIDSGSIRIPDNVQLADPTFNISADIDLLIGADIFWDLLNDDRLRLPNGPYLQNSKLGWLLSGPIFAKAAQSTHVQCHFSQDIDKQLRLFWELESIPTSPSSVLTEDERKCEELFINTHLREDNGKFSVRIPLRDSPDTLGDSYTFAKKRFFNLERKLERLPELKRRYTEFMREYNDLGHMTKINECGHPNYYLPHHGVIKESSTTTKLRVVFDASAVTSSNKSLNDIQYPGPALQNDIFSILLRFRQYKYVACADVEKCFRNVLIQPDQRSLQLILWRESPTEPLNTYQLNTVTYGTTSAPYLSMRCIRQLALECDDKFIARIITEDIFVDDLITGDDDHRQLIRICQKTSDVLQSGCFPLRKWTFNSDTYQCESVEHFIGEHSQTKTLGLGWHNTSDELYFVTNIESNYSKLTKRVMLSILSQIYDPLGLLSPVVIIPKLLLQKLWLSKIDWDTPVPLDIVNIWHNFVETLRYLKDIRIIRHVRGAYTQYTELHIFSDASQDAYGACAYIRTYSDNSEVTVRLLCAKSKVAPLKSISVPRLELCGALIGAKLYKKIVESLRLEFSKVYFWTDSTIVMGWLKMSPHLLKTFVQNRVSEINELTGDSVWLHVGSKDNPADLLSRGYNLDLLKDCDLWWNGPPYLRNLDNYDRCDITDVHDLPELKCKQTCLLTTDYEDIIDFERYGSFSKLIRIGAYLLRFIDNVRIKTIHKDSRRTGSLSVSECNAAQKMFVRLVQRKSFADVYNSLINNIPLNRKCKQYSQVSGLNVFIDTDKIIRVGGRLGYSSSFNYSKKHPVLLCSKHPFTIILFRYEHLRLLHAGPQLLLASVRECWWPLNGRNLARKTVHGCVRCTRMRGKALTPIMGNLPADRLEPGFPFIKAGVDYAGPVYILNRKGRGAQLIKAYICVFVCFATRAIHLELVTSLSSSDYILALKRFISRRGKPNVIFSDNGKNFVGAEKEFPLFLERAKETISNYATDNKIEFRFIPPYSPHFGGLWESGVRSCKYHLRRILGNARLTFEEFSTALAQIEAVLNSRPLSPLSSDPSDLTPLTPAHFLIGRPLTAPPSSEDLTEQPTLRLSRYERIEQLRQQFWRRWSMEYISELQKRTKWKTQTQQNNINIGSLVLIKDDKLPPLNWQLGRVVRVHPGKDGVIRVVDVRTTSGITRRAVAKICLLPLQPIGENA